MWPQVGGLPGLQQKANVILAEGKNCQRRSPGCPKHGLKSTKHEIAIEDEQMSTEVI